MSGTSITGKGNGAALNQKGPKNNRDYFVPAVNPHIVASGQKTMVSTVGTVVLAADSVAANYIVLATSTDATARAVCEAHTVTNGVMTITLKSILANDVINYSVIRMQGASQITE